MKPIGPYSHLTVANGLISISAIAGVDAETNELAGADIESQTTQILKSIDALLRSVHSDFDHVLHINVFLTDMALFQRMNAVYAEMLGESRPARTAIAVAALPKPGALVTMNATAVVKP
jgi:2-iminobutanoate/2-iminopropanoate deaminase